MASVRLREDVGKTVKARIAGDEFDAFDIEYASPDAAIYLEADWIRTHDGVAKAILWLSAECLRGWSLGELPADADGRAQQLARLEPHSALLAIYLEIRERGQGALKN